MLTVHVTRLAEEDIAAVLDYLLAQDAAPAASELLRRFENAFASLKKYPARGHVPPELLEYPDKRIRELHVGVYRLIYRYFEQDVYVLFVADGRRNIQDSLLERALRFGV
jgi:toxin ParE1/3/4